ncbi:hypothetical protein Tco_0058736, partial [Tanacetum coccineum]
MRTRNSHFPNNSPVTIPKRRNRRRAPNVVEPELRTIVEVAPMADNRTMEELLQAPMEGYGEAIVIPEINADHFEIKTNLLQLVQASPFHVPNDVIKLMMFPYSLEGAARIWVNSTSREISSKTDERIDKLADQISTLVEIVTKKVVTPSTVKAVEEICVTCGGPHAYYNCLNTDSNQSSVCAATASTSGTLPSNTIANPKGEMKAITTRSGVAYEGPSIPTNPSPKKNCFAVLLKKLSEKLGDPCKFLIPCDFPGMVECSALADLGASINLMPLPVWKRLSLPELTTTHMTLELADHSLIFGRPFLWTSRALIDVYGEEITLRFNDEAITFNLGQTLRYSSDHYAESVNQIDIIDVACDEYSQEVLGFTDGFKSGNPTSTDPIIATSFPSLTPFEG